MYASPHQGLAYIIQHKLSKNKVLLEAPFDPIRRQMNSVLLTIDLTKAVADEAVERKDCVVVSYRIFPFISPSKSHLPLTVPLNRPHNLSRLQSPDLSRHAATIPPPSRPRGYLRLLPPHSRRRRPWRSRRLARRHRNRHPPRSRT